VVHDQLAGLTRRVKLQILAGDFAGRDKTVVAFLNDLDLASLHGEFEHGDYAVSHELRGYRVAAKAWVFLFATRNILPGLDNGELVRTTFCLNGNDELLPVLVDTDVDFVDLDLASPFTVVRMWFCNE